VPSRGAADILQAVNARERQRLAALEDRRRSLATQLAQVGFISRGSVVTSYTACGKDSCRCRSDPRARHGPYWQWSRAVRGRTVTTRLSEGQAALYREWIANQRTLDGIVRRIQEVSRRASQILLREAERTPATPADAEARHR